jgi:NAD(P)-dependent dehydrogenase (short-subunit alcohol dehydrogenase family)
VNCVAPGYTDTDMIAAIPGNVLERYVSQIPVGRLGRPEEVARVVHFLAEDDAFYITGAVIPVNGGLEM